MNLETPEAVLLGVGGLLLAGLGMDALGRLTPLPRVTLLLLFGVAIGPYGLDWIPPQLTANFDLIADMALLMVGFLLGGMFTPKTIRAAGRGIGMLVLGEGVGTALVVGLGLTVFGVPLMPAMLLACIAAASAPAATIDVVEEERARGPFTDTLLAVVALDDALGLLLFSCAIGVVSALQGEAGGVAPFVFAIREMGGAVLLGLALGIPGAQLTGRIRPGEPSLVEALGLVFLCGGLALVLEVSFLIASMSMGAAIANLAKHHEYPFHAIEGIEWPFMIVFFSVAGAVLEIAALAGIGAIGAVYVICRFAGKVGGSYVGAFIGGIDGAARRWLGLALLPQAGVAMGMALVAANEVPAHAQTMLSLVISTTVLFELVGPIFTRSALRRVGDSGRAVA